MPDPTKPPSSPDSASVSDPNLKATRRRLLQGGLAAAPVLMTLASRPVLAQTCTTPSGYVSANASRPGGSSCSGYGPSHWYGQINWPSTYKPNDNFKKYFSPDLTLPNVSGATKLIDVVNPAQTTNVVARYLVAALLNTGPPVLTPVLSTAAAVTGMWSEFAQAGSYSPSSGAFWSADELIDYLQTTMITS
jgi:hypothetical protein